MKKGFTLIELLVVIAILAILAVVVVIVINPAELLRQSRDSTRLSDLSSLMSAIALFLADQAPSSWTSVTYCTATPGSSNNITGCTVRTSTAIDGNGWVNINFNSISSGAPLSKLPLDPANGTTNCGGTNENCFYFYRSSSTVGFYKIGTNLESNKYKNQETTDGGTFNALYEMGSDMNL